jgi:uncharacterized membrane protein
VSGSSIEILDLVARWIHVIAAIMWVGNSLLFNWLDRSLVPANAPGQTKKPIGTIWLLHSGGFYYVEKTLLDGEKLPAPLHWFMWQAITTWISGVALLIVVYYASGRAMLEDPTVAGLTHGKAIAVGIGAIVIGRIIYDVMQRFSTSAPVIATAVWMIALTAIAIALTQLLSGRAAFLHVGAMLGTIMAGNVTSTIVPSQHALVKSVTEGGAGDPAISAKAKRVSIHNNYFTFPVIALMLSNHFSSIYGSRYNWLLMLVIVAGGAAVRHVLNLRWTWPAWKPALGASIAATVILLWGILRFGNASSANVAVAPTGPVSFEDARHIIDRRCAVCHSERPIDLTYGGAPVGVMFDTRAQIEAKADRIRERAFVTHTMPPANKTGISDAERAILGRWAAAAATGQLPR